MFSDVSVNSTLNLNARPLKSLDLNRFHADQVGEPDGSSSVVATYCSTFVSENDEPPVKSSNKPGSESKFPDKVSNVTLAASSSLMFSISIEQRATRTEPVSM